MFGNDCDVEKGEDQGDITARRIALALWMQNVWPNAASYSITLQALCTVAFRVAVPIGVSYSFGRLTRLEESPWDLTSRMFLMIVGGHLQLSLLTFLTVSLPVNVKMKFSDIVSLHCLMTSAGGDSRY
eukprot:gb/GECG01002493.1/.p1 GENE.gb/GECG01002493.1/~~gb/GECG01002493.1/.p1  ORF type:complete len:128 (+),score=5.76 gb/GECG01002493.1/:1-384(+)